MKIAAAALHKELAAFTAENSFRGKGPVALNVYELGKFAAEGRKTAVTDIVGRYNEIVEEFETDPSLKIELRR